MFPCRLAFFVLSIVWRIMPISAIDQLAALATSFQSVLVNSFVPFDMKDLASQDFPYSEYTTNIARYKSAVDWFTGEALEPNDPQSKVPEAYPIRINPINGTCLKHGYALFGESNNDSRPLVIPRMVLDDPEKQREIARKAEKSLNFLWWESFGRSMMLENGITSQIFGGCVFYIRYVPWETWRKIPFRLERMNPDCFMGTPVYGDQYRLEEAWVVKNIRPKDAARYGVDIPDGQPAYWVEKHDQDKFKITINNKLIKFTKNGVDFSGEGENPWDGIVPMVYIPHIKTGNFYGQNNIDHLKGIVKEINLRFADFGDAVNSDAHSAVAVRNTQGTPRVSHLTNGLEVIDLGSAVGITGNEPDPDMLEVRKAMASAPMDTMLKSLYDQYRRDAAHPAVADGEDEGSQRSAATLVARMWPLTSHINMERINWTGGLDWLTVMALRMMKIKGVGEITQDHLDMRVTQAWAPILPKDREQFINELTNRVSANLGSMEHLLEMTGDTEDVDDEMRRIKAWIKFNAELKRTSTGVDDQGNPDPNSELNPSDPAADKSKLVIANKKNMQNQTQKLPDNKKVASEPNE
jgi:hypothetical protein